MRTDGRIFKLLGNHEVFNININYDSSNYYFQNDQDIYNSKTFKLDKKNYYLEYSRSDVFKLNNPGFDLLFKDGCGSLLKINNYIFVHGQLNGYDYNYYDNINKLINDRATSSKKFEEIMDDLMIASNTDPYDQTINSHLWARMYGDPERIHERLQNTNFGTKFCDENVINNFKKFLENSNLSDQPETLKIIIGHCVQSNSRDLDLVNKTFVNTTYTDSIKEIISGPAHFGLTNIQNNLIFGITMECPNDIHTNTSHKIYKVDIGSSRAFDSIYYNNNIIDSDDKLDEEKYTYLSRSPQVLEIINNQEKIIRSKLKNTRIHQPRYQYEKLITDNKVLELKLDSGNYTSKYLKYKQKYLKLVKKLELKKINK